MALSFCHLMEMAPRLMWEPSLWMATTTFGGLYYLFGRIGAVIDVSTIVVAGILAFASFRRSPSFGLSLAGFLLFAAGLATWFSFVAPMNAIMSGWTEGHVPPDFHSVRNQWEFSHATIAAIKFGGLACLVLSVLADTPEWRKRGGNG